MQIFARVGMLLLVAGCEPPPPRMTLEQRAMSTCAQMGVSPGQPAYVDCVTRMYQSYSQAETANTTSRRAAAAMMYRQPQPIQIQTAPQPGMFGYVPQVQVPQVYPR